MRRGVKYLLKSSSKNIKIDPKFVPELVSMEEVQEYASIHKLGLFETDGKESTTEDADFDVEELLKKRKADNNDLEPAQDKRKKGKQWNFHDF